MKKFILLFLMVALAGQAVVMPKVWVASETIKAADLNADFNALKNAYNKHGQLSELYYPDSKHTGFVPEGGTSTRLLEVYRLIDKTGKIVFPVNSVTTLPAASSTEMGELTLVTAAERVLYITQGAATGVPVMTGYTAPNGSTIYSSEYSTGYPAWHVFDGIATTTWKSSAILPHSIGYQFAASITVNAVFIQPANYFDHNVLDWTVDYSDADAATWTVIATYTNMPVPEGGAEFFVASATPHLSWRIHVTDVQTKTADNLELIALDFIQYTKAINPVTMPSYSQGVTATFTLPYNFGVSSWTLGVSHGLIASITTP